MSGFDRPRVLWAVTGLVYVFLFAPMIDCHACPV